MPKCHPRLRGCAIAGNQSRRCLISADMAVNWMLRNIPLTLVSVSLFGDKIVFKSYYSKLCIRRSRKSHQHRILSLMLCWSHLDIKEKTTLGLIALKETSLLRVCLCSPNCLPPVSLCVCAYVCVCDGYVVDLLGSAFASHATLSVCSRWWTANLWRWD